MRETELLIKTIKMELRRQGKTYADLTGPLNLSHASVKRVFAEKNFSMDRIEVISRCLGLNFLDLARKMEECAEKVDYLKLEQEKELVSDIKLLCLAHSLLNRWSFDEVIATYDIDVHEGIKLMARLDRMQLIELLPENRYRLLVSHKFSWIPAGPIQKFFDKQLQSDYFATSFNGLNEKRIFVSSMLSQESIEKLGEGFRKLEDEVNALHTADEKLPLSKRSGHSVLLTMRPWEARVFAEMRRTRS